ncbi:DNA-directed RNA polymerase subunit beta [Marisediminicola senii]|uniref:DNA-directed RNA polymerase subunit beta n=1 Tax=Marisediminicola senii TaxID=2711233 RepID=UPI0013EC6864|nr:DNA-directed RNA polymerase subunit beta [Marisediminicola senii]
MTDEFHKPTKFSGAKFEGMMGGEDPAQISRIAHETAQALMARVKTSADPGVVDRLVAFTDEHGIDAIAELWSPASPHSLPGALWRIYLLRALVRQDATGTSFLYVRGTEIAPTIDPVVAGATSPTGPEEITQLADQILRGLFTGDFAIALERASAFCRITAAGAAYIADDVEFTDDQRATDLTRKGLRLSTTAEELTACARLWRNGSLD